MHAETFPVGPLQANCSLVWEAKDAALVVDPGDEGPRVAARLQDFGLTPGLVVSTHGHFDHTGGVRHLQEAFGVPYKVHEAELPTLRMIPARTRIFGVVTGEPPVPDGYLADGERIRLGGLDVTVLHTPGHTPGSLSLHAAGAGLVLTGDTLFRGSIGRTDFPGGDQEQELRSIRERLFALPPETKVVPGHGPRTTIGFEAENNPWVV